MADLMDEIRKNIDEIEKRAWTRGFFNALAYHCEGRDREEGIGSTGLDTPRKAVAAGADQQDVDRMLADFRFLRERLKGERATKRRAAKAANGGGNG